jgi:16S rRNA (cytosine1402-N4)-methyltransferase
MRLAAIVEAAVGGRRGSPTHPATQTFLALRMAVNDEMGALAAGHERTVAALRPVGRLAVISFHSIEDRLVKQTLRTMAATCVCPPEQPICTCDTTPADQVLGKPIRPGRG